MGHLNTLLAGLTAELAKAERDGRAQDAQSITAAIGRVKEAVSMMALAGPCGRTLALARR